MFRLLGFVAAFYRRWMNWELLLVVFGVTAFASYDLYCNPPGVPDQVTRPRMVSWAELVAQGPGEQQLVVEGQVDQSAYLKRGSYDRYYPFFSGDQTGILVRFNSSSTVPGRATHLQGRLSRPPSEVIQTLEQAGGRLGSHQLRTDLVFEVGFSGPLSRGWKFGLVACGGLYLLAALWAWRCKTVVFVAENRPDRSAPSSQFKMACCGNFRSEDGSKKLFLFQAPVVGADATDGRSGALVSRIGPELWAIELRKGLDCQRGDIYLAFSKCPALRFRNSEGEFTYLTFDSCEDRAGCLDWLGTMGQIPVAQGVGPEEEQSGEISTAVPTPYANPVASPFVGIGPVLVTVPAAGLCVGTLYFGVGQVFNLLLVSQLLFGLLLGWLVTRICLGFRYRYAPVIFGLTLLSGSICVATNYVFESQKLRPAMLKALGGSPEADRALTGWLTLKIYLQACAESGLSFGEIGHDNSLAVSEGGRDVVVGTSGDFQFRGWAFWCYLLAEFGLVAGIAATYARAEIGWQPYCANCQRFFETTLARVSPADHIDFAKKNFLSGQWEELRKLPGKAGPHSLELELRVCPGCAKRAFTLRCRAKGKVRLALAVDADQAEQLKRILCGRGS